MQFNSSSCITILAMGIHVMHSLIIANTWSSGMTCLNVLGGRWVFFGGITHLDCRSPDRRVRKELHNSSCVTDGVLSVFIRLIIVTPRCFLSGNIDFQPQIYNTLWRPIVFLHLKEGLFLFLSLPIRQRHLQVSDTSEKKKKKQLSDVFYLSLNSNTETKTDFH